MFIFKCTILRKSTAIEHAHIRDVDYNPKKQNIIVSSTLTFLFPISSNTSYIFAANKHSYELAFCSNIEDNNFVLPSVSWLHFNFILLYFDHGVCIFFLASVVKHHVHTGV